MTAGLLALLDELDAAREEATPGPWVHNPTNGIHTPIGSCVATTHRHENAERRADAALIVAAVNALPKLTAALRAALELTEQFEAEAEVREVRATTYPPSGPWAIDHNRLVVRADTLRRSATRLCYVLTTALEAQPRGES